MWVKYYLYGCGVFSWKKLVLVSGGRFFLRCTVGWSSCMEDYPHSLPPTLALQNTGLPFAPCTLPPRKTSFPSLEQGQLAAWEKTWSFEARDWGCGRHRSSFKNSSFEEERSFPEGDKLGFWAERGEESEGQQEERKGGKGSPLQVGDFGEVHEIAYSTFPPIPAK